MTAAVIQDERIFEKTVGDRTVRLTATQIEAFGAELDAIRERVVANLGERDADYIRRLVKVQRGLEIGGRASFSCRHCGCRELSCWA